MSNFTFNRGDLNTVMLTVVGLSGTPLNFPDDYTTPTIMITHVNGGGEIIDLVVTSMARLGTSNRWYHKYTVPIAASYTKYLTTFNTVIDGISTTTAEEFRVIPISSISGSGEFEIVITLKNSVTLQPIHDATINIYDKNNPTIIIATGQTDSNGIAICFLSAGTYLAEFRKTGVISEVHTMVVDSLGNYIMDGD